MLTISVHSHQGSCIPLLFPAQAPCLFGIEAYRVAFWFVVVTRLFNLAERQGVVVDIAFRKQARESFGSISRGSVISRYTIVVLKSGAKWEALVTRTMES